MNIQNFINGKFENPIRNDWVDNYCPAIGEVDGIGGTLFPAMSPIRLAPRKDPDRGTPFRIPEDSAACRPLGL